MTIVHRPCLNLGLPPYAVITHLAKILQSVESACTWICGASAISSTSSVQFSEAAARRGDGNGGHGHRLTTPFHQRGATRERHVRHQAHFRVQGGALRTEVLLAHLLFPYL
ncbi:uncharacterized protein TNCV_3848091 [Trichonephila clavipes]|uniref:Uncharacterized protein n=1 Tax=Trichonephila clavipes TaxID=2585209 RepID=A0A8X6RDM0_TRICX|nr:uncharacterized protein TNCV_3848091 [Trichonephila clavipes]